MPQVYFTVVRKDASLSYWHVPSQKSTGLTVLFSRLLTTNFEIADHTADDTVGF